VKNLTVGVFTSPVPEAVIQVNSVMPLIFLSPIRHLNCQFCFMNAAKIQPVTH